MANAFDLIDPQTGAALSGKPKPNAFDSIDPQTGESGSAPASAKSRTFSGALHEGLSRLSEPGGLFSDLGRHFTGTDAKGKAVSDTERLQVADRLSGLSIPTRLIEEPVRGFLEGFGADPGAVDIGEMILSYGTGARSLRAGGALKPKPGTVLPPSAIEKRVGAALDAALTQDQVKPHEFMGRLARGVPPVAAGGPHMAELGVVAARAGGESQAALSKTVNARAAEAPERIMSTIQEKLGVDPEAARGDMASVLERGRAAAAPLFDAIKTDETVLPESPELTSILKTPAGQEALKAAVTTLKNKREDPLNYGFQLVGGDAVHGPELVELKSLSPRTLDLVRREANGLVQRDKHTRQELPDSVARGNSGYSQVARDLTTALAGDETSGGLVPGLRNALDVSGEYLAPTETFARNRGALFGTRVAEFERRWKAARGDVEHDAIRAALANDVREAYEKKGVLDPDAFSTPGVRAKLELAFGKDATDTFLADMNEHAGELDALGRVQSGIKTAQSAGARALVQTTKSTKALSTGEVYHIMTSPKTGIPSAILSRLKLDPSIAANPRAMELLANAVRDPKEMARLLAISRSGSVGQRAAARRLRRP